MDKVKEHGLKDHEIAELTNRIKINILSFMPNAHQSLREIISQSIVSYLNEKGLRRDGKA